VIDRALGSAEDATNPAAAEAAEAELEAGAAPVPLSSCGGRCS
jgi:hypothetical protein